MSDEDAEPVINVQNRLLMEAITAQMAQKMESCIDAFCQELKPILRRRYAPRRGHGMLQHDYENKERVKAAKNQLSFQKQETNQPSPIQEKFKKPKEVVKSTSIKKIEEEILNLLNTYNKPTKAKAKCVISSESTRDMCDLSFEKTGSVLDNDQACEQLTSLEPVIPSSALSFSQVLEEKSQREAPRTLPLNCDLEQLPKLVPESFQKPIPHDYPRKHCKEFDLARTEPSLLVLVSAQDEKRFGLENVKDFCVSQPVLLKLIPIFETFTLEGFFKINGSLLDKFREFNPSLRISLDSHAFELSRNETEYALVKTSSEFNHLHKIVLCESNMFNKVYKQAVEHLAFESFTSSIMRLFCPMSDQKGIGAKEKHEYFGEWTIKEKPPDLHWRHSIYKDFKQGTMSKAEQRNVKTSSIFKDEPPDATYKPKEDELVTNKILIQEEPPYLIPLALMISSFEHIKDLLQVSNSLTQLVPHNLETVIMSSLLPEHVKKLDLFKYDSEQISCFRKEEHGKYNVVIQADTFLFVYNNSMTAIIHLLFAKGVAYIAGVKEEPPDKEVLSSYFFARTGIKVVLTKKFYKRSVLVELTKKFGILSKAIKESYCDVEPHLKLHKTNAQSSDLRGKHSVTLFFDDSNLLLFVADDPDLRSNLFQEGGDDMSMESSKDLEPEDEIEAKEALLVPAGPMAFSRDNAFNKALRGLLDLFFANVATSQLEENANQTTLVSPQAQ